MRLLEAAEVNLGNEMPAARRQSSNSLYFFAGLSLAVFFSKIFNHSP